MLFLCVSATLSDNIKQVSLKDDESSMAEYVFDITCINCREPNDSPILINRFERHAMSGSKGEASFVMKCKFCSNEISINVAQYEQALLNVDHTDEDILYKIREKRKKRGIKGIDMKIAALLEMDCRGCEINQFHTANIEFIVELTSGKRMDFQFDEEECEWYDYDDDAAEEVSIVDFTSHILKGK